jgi:formyl-CoA transferase
MPSRPLEGVLVADFSRVLAGPLATQTLADLGADVVKVERPQTGDDTRAWGASYFLGLNRGKRSITLDLKDDADLVLARRLCERADVVVESFRPGVMERLGLGPGVSPHAVHCSITAFGEHDLPGYDLLLQAVSGLMHVTGEEDGRPLKVGAAVIDLVCGLHAAVGILASLRDPLRPPVTVSLMDSALTALVNQAAAHLNEGAEPTRLGNRHPAIAPYETFGASDGELAVACGNDAMFARLAAAVGRPDLAGEERFATNDARLAHRDALAAALGEAFATDTVAGWVERLRTAGVPAGPINDVGAAFAYADELGLEPVWELDGVRTVRSPLRGLTAPTFRPPHLGEHSRELRAWLEQDEG